MHPPPPVYWGGGGGGAQVGELGERAWLRFSRQAKLYGLVRTPRHHPDACTSHESQILVAVIAIELNIRVCSCAAAPYAQP